MFALISDCILAAICGTIAAIILWVIWTAIQPTL